MAYARKENRSTYPPCLKSEAPAPTAMGTGAKYFSDEVPAHYHGETRPATLETAVRHG